MKTLLKSLMTFSLLFTHFLFAQTITKSTFLVKGDCGMCKERIETTAKKTGASIANWNAETQKLSVEFDSAKTSAEEILKKIAAVGHVELDQKGPGFSGQPGPRQAQGKGSGGRSDHLRLL